MAKRKRNLESKIDKLIKEGRGQGIGKDYKPWLFIQDVPSLGRATRLKGIKTGRQHEFLSDMERDYFYMLEYSDNIADIREQFPLLPIEETILIASEAGIKHPKNPKTGEHIVMTTDFLVTKKSGNGELIELARTIKPKEELLDRRVLEKFEIEKRYWQKQGIDWGIVTEEEIHKVLARNISYVHSYYDLEDIDALREIDKDMLEDVILEYTRRLIDKKESIRTISSGFDRDLMLNQGTGVSIFKYLIINKILNLELAKPIDINRRIEVSLNAEIMNKKVSSL